MVLHNVSQLGEPDDALRRQVGDVGDAVKRQQVVHAQRLERDITHDDELVVALVVGERGQVERLAGRVVGAGQIDAAGVARHRL